VYLFSSLPFQKKICSSPQPKTLWETVRFHAGQRRPTRPASSVP
jgi:hypothetical protein